MIFESPEKKNPEVKEERRSMKEMRGGGSSEGRYHNMNVGFDGMLTFNRFR